MNEDNKQNEELNEDIAEASGPAQAEGADALLAERDAEIAELKDRLLRAAAETENVRRRLEREKADASTYAATGLARDTPSTPANPPPAIPPTPQPPPHTDRVNPLTP